MLGVYTCLPINTAMLSLMLISPKTRLVTGSGMFKVDFTSEDNVFFDAILNPVFARTIIRASPTVFTEVGKRNAATASKGLISAWVGPVRTDVYRPTCTRLL